MTTTEGMMRIGEVAQRAGVSVRSVRYYEQQGLVSAERSPSGQRLYTADVVERVRFIQEMFTAGLTSRDVAQLMPCMEAGHTDAEQRSMLRAVRERVRARAEELQDTLRRLDDVITVTDGHP